MAPTLFALSIAGVAHAQGTMDFSGATTLMTTFKTFAIYAGAVICFGGLIFAGIRMMSGRFQDAIPGLFGALFGAGVLGWLSPLPECPIQLDSRKIPENFLDSFRNRDCASLDCQTCGYCERIAAQAVSISPAYRTEVLNKYAEMDETMATGRLWGV
jgi:hypothetical protein